MTKFSPAGSSLVYSTYLGGSVEDFVSGIAVDSSGNAYVTGQTNSRNFPTANALQPAIAGGAARCCTFDAFVTKINPSGSALVYSTYLGGGGQDRGYGIAVDSLSNAYVTGYTGSVDFPTASSLQLANAGSDVFVTKFNPAGSALVYSTYFGGRASDIGYGIAVDSSGNAYVTGSTTSPNFPTANPRQPAYGGGNLDAFVTKFNPSGSALIYSTYLGGGGTDSGSGIAVDSSGNAYVTGSTTSPNFPTASPLQPTYSGLTDFFVTKFHPSGSALIYSTYFGGNGADYGKGIAVDSSDNAYVTGTASGSGGADASVMVIKDSPFPIAFFPHMAIGGGFSTLFTVGNTESITVEANLILTDQQGNPLTVNAVLGDATTSPQSAPSGGQANVAGSSFPFSIPAGGTAFLAASALNPDDPTKSGWATLETSGGSLTGVATFQFVSNGIVESIAGVLASQRLQYAAIPVDNDDSQNRFTGYAIANPGLKSISIKLATVNQSGNLVDDSVVITLGAGQQIARFLHQELPARLKFKGSIVLRGQSGGTFVVVALVQNQDQFTVVPVSAEKAPHIPN